MVEESFIEIKDQKFVVDEKSQSLLKKNNRIKTTMYNIYTFLPLSLFNQFRQFTNIFFLLKSILTLFPVLTSINPLALWIPLIYIIIFSMCFDLYQDLKRYRADKKQNNEKASIIRNGKLLNIKAQEIRIGDIVVMEEDEIVRVDVILLTYKNKINYCYIDTSSLDGEKTLKPRMSVLNKNLNISNFLDQTEKLFSNDDKINLTEDSFNHFKMKDRNEISFPNIKLTFTDNDPNLYKFSAKIDFQIKNSENGIEEVAEVLDINNFIPRSSIIKNSYQVLGLVVYIGHDTKVMKNTQKRIFKLSNTERLMNFYIFFVVIFFFLLLLFLCIYSLFQNRKFHFALQILQYRVNKNNSEALVFLYTFLGYLILCSSMVPITLIISLQFIKLIQNGFFLMNEEFKDKITKKNCSIRTFNISEDLGQIEYILSDKTGTLTENKMVPKYFQINNFSKKLVDNNNNENLSSPLEMDECEESNEHIKLINTKVSLDRNEFTTNIREKNFANYQDIYDDERLFKKFKLESSDKSDCYIVDSQETLNHLFYLNINTCQSCFPILDEINTENDYNFLKNHIKYEGSSPDEIALLNGSKDFCNYLLLNTTLKEIELMHNNEKILIKKLHSFQFDSERKMMSVIIQVNGHIFQMVKGADSALIEKSDTKLEKIFLEKYDSYLDLGYRMMFFGIKLISKSELRKYEEVLAQPNLKPKDILSFKTNFENNLTIIGASAIEDKLQEGVKDTINYLKKSGIKIWMITGDKTETALNIAISSNLFEKNEETIVVDNEDDLDTFINFYDKLKSSQKKDNKFFFRFGRVPHKENATNLSNLSLEEGRKIKYENSETLIITGNVLPRVLKDPYREKFRNIILNKKCVVFSRTNANQKVEIVRLLKEIKKKILAVGDGANDVNMIQEANIGVGISGEEGKHAESASDFSIPKFRFLKPLVLHHGRISYYRVSQFVLFFYYKCYLELTPQIYFAFFNDFSRQNFYQDFYSGLYLMLFTVFNVSSKALVDIDIDNRAVYYNKNFILESSLYYLGSQNQLFNSKKFVFWILTSILEAGYIFFMGYFLLHNSLYDNYHPMDYYTFSLLIFSVIIIYQHVKLFYLMFNFDVINCVGIGLCLLIYFLYVLVTDRNVLLGYYHTLQKSFFNSKFYIYLIFIIFSTQFVHQTFYVLKRYVFPSIKDRIRNLKHQIREDKLELQLCNWRILEEKNKVAKIIFH